MYPYKFSQFCIFFTVPDIRGPDYPAPYFDSKVKVRWDDTRLYIGARMEQTDFWGNITEDESLGIYCRLYDNRQSPISDVLYFANLDCRFIKAEVDY